MYLIIEDFLFKHFFKRDDSKLNRQSVLIAAVLVFSSTYLVSLLPFAVRHTVILLIYLGIIFFTGYMYGWRCSLFSFVAVLVCSCFSLVVLRLPYYQSSSFEILLFLLESLVIIGAFFLFDGRLSSMRERELRFRTVIERSAEAMLICDGDLQVSFSCNSAEYLLGYNGKGLENQNLLNLIHPDDIDTFLKAIDKLKLKGEGSLSISQRIRGSGGHWIWTENCINNLLNEKYVGAFVIHLRNITRSLEKEKQQQTFLDMASHELKNPITAIKGFLHILNNFGYPNGDGSLYHGMIGKVEAQTEKMLYLIEDLLNVTRIKNGELQYRFITSNFAECLREVVAAMQVSNPNHQFDLELPAEPVIMVFDKMRIGQVVTNLLNNAVKYSPGQNSIHVIAGLDDNCVRVTVKDHGIGIPVEKQHYIFDRFYRVDTLPKGKFKGLGLGLYIAAEIVRYHHGNIGVESKDGEGSSFWFTLPSRP